MTPEKIRHKRLILGTLILIICGMLYYCFVKITGVGIPCVFRLITGLKCPGCGISTVIMELLEGDLPAAYAANPFLLVTSPFILFEVIFAFYLAWTAKCSPRWNEILLIIYLVALILFGILRNII